MMPLPTHLWGCVVPDDQEASEADLKGQVRCPCGSARFHLLYPGQTCKQDGQSFPCTIEVGGRYFFLVKAECATCNKEYLLFDADYHGWDGFVCHDSEQASFPRPLLTVWRCRACGYSEHRASVQIETQGKDDFATETAGLFADELWPDAFTWFGMAITCCGCGCETEQWVSYETA